MESWLEKLGVLRSVSRPNVSNYAPYSESKFSTNYQRQTFESRDEAYQEVASFED